jgi:hypothetical protein
MIGKWVENNFLIHLSFNAVWRIISDPFKSIISIFIAVVILKKYYSKNFKKLFHLKFELKSINRNTCDYLSSNPAMIFDPHFADFKVRKQTKCFCVRALKARPDDPRIKSWDIKSLKDSDIINSYVILSSSIAFSSSKQRKH